MITIKAIQGILKRKIAAWLESIEDEELRKAVANDVVVTGGCITSLLTGTKVNDYDVYLKGKDTVIALASYYLERFAKNPPPRFKGGESVKMWLDTEEPGRVKIVVKSAGAAGEKGDKDTYQYFETVPDSNAVEEYVEQVTSSMDTEEITPSYVHDAEDIGVDEASPEFRSLVQEVGAQDQAPPEAGKGKDEYRPVFLTGNAITLSDSIQICIRFYGPIEVVHKNFDFVHCTNYYDYAADELVLAADALAATLTKELRYVGSKYPICSVIRTRKFIKRGWSCNAGQYVKMAHQISQLNLNSVDVWEDQLIGVDTAYFADLIARLRAEEAEGKPVDGNYVISLVEKLF